MILIDYPEGRKIAKIEHYSQLLKQLDAAITERQPQLRKKKPLFYHDNSPVNTNACVIAKLNTLRY